MEKMAVVLFLCIGLFLFIFGFFVQYYFQKKYQTKNCTVTDFKEFLKSKKQIKKMYKEISLKKDVDRNAIYFQQINENISRGDYYEEFVEALCEEDDEEKVQIIIETILHFQEINRRKTESLNQSNSVDNFIIKNIIVDKGLGRGKNLYQLMYDFVSYKRFKKGKYVPIEQAVISIENHHFYKGDVITDYFNRHTLTKETKKIMNIV